MGWSSAFQRDGGVLWFKTQKDWRGRKHMLVSTSRSGVDGGSHDHYWENGDGTYGVQLRDQSGSASVNIDGKGHIYSHNTSFPAMTNKYLKDLFNELF
jgi:hypothetical protein